MSDRFPSNTGNDHCACLSQVVDGRLVTISCHHHLINPARGVRPMPLVRAHEVPEPSVNIDRQAGQVPDETALGQQYAVQGTILPIDNDPDTSMTMQDNVLEPTPPDTPNLGRARSNSQQQSSMTPSLFTPPLVPAIAQNVTAPAATQAAAGLAATTFVVAPSPDLVEPGSTHIAASELAQGSVQAAVQHAASASLHPRGAASSNEVILRPSRSRESACNNREYTAESLLKTELEFYRTHPKGRSGVIHTQRANDSPVYGATPPESSFLRQSLHPHSFSKSSVATTEKQDGMKLQTSPLGLISEISPLIASTVDDIGCHDSGAALIPIEQRATQSVTGKTRNRVDVHRCKEKSSQWAIVRKLRTRSKHTFSSIKQSSVKILHKLH